MNADANKAAWISYDETLDPWTSKVFSNKPLFRRPAPDYLGGFERPVFSSSALPLNVAPPAAQIITDRQERDIRKIHIKITSARRAPVISMIFANGSPPVSVKIGERALTFSQHSGFHSVRLFGMGVDGAELELTFSTRSKVTFWLMDETYGLPTRIDPRTDEFMAGEGSDVTLMCRRYNL